MLETTEISKSDLEIYIFAILYINSAIISKVISKIICSINHKEENYLNISQSSTNFDPSLY
jgi:hypothetical protein